jgi:hypothetical protein
MEGGRNKRERGKDKIEVRRYVPTYNTCLLNWRESGRCLKDQRDQAVLS